MSLNISAYIDGTMPEFSSEEYPGNIYYNPAHNAFIFSFHNLYEEEEINNWIPQKIRDGQFKFVKRNSEVYYAKEQASPFRTFYMKYCGEIPIISDQWIIISHDLLRDEEQEEEAQQLLAEEQAAFNVTNEPLLPPDLLANLLQPQLSLLDTAALLLAEPINHWNSYHYSCYSYNQPAKVQPPQKRVEDIMIADAMSKGGCCPITMNPLTSISAKCVAPCYHIFEKEAIQTWLNDNNTCPECRIPCSL
jgi:hypothetical protein